MRRRPGTGSGPNAWEKDAQAFRRATTRVRMVQKQVLKRILRENSTTAYGRRFGFAGITASDEYRRQVPLVDYADLAPEMARIAAGERDVLFPGRPLCLQPTSGTTAGAKLIPSTAALRAQFRRGVSAWYGDLLALVPALATGRAYWSVSPVLRDATATAGGVPVGFLDDAEYLPPAMAAALAKTFAVPGSLGLVRDMELFRYLTLAFLLKARNLVFVSVWNPTFFLLLLEALPAVFERIVEDIARGRLSPIEHLPVALRAPFACAFGAANRQRADELRTLGATLGSDFSGTLQQLWPDLRLLSCWADAAAKGPAARLHRLFPAALVQPKGLIATEALVTIPLHEVAFPVLSLHSHFFEFLPAGEAAETVYAWELEPEKLYEVVVTTAGGLYRYRLGDLVMVRGHYGDCPMLEFMGRGNHTSDFHGEKLHQLQVTAAIGELFGDRDPASWFALLAPDGEPEVERYTLFVACDGPPDPAWLVKLASGLESRLRANFHYDYCRRLGQLREAAVCLIGPDVAGALRKYMEEQKRRGIREGDIKPALLDNRPVWRRVFAVNAAGGNS